MKKKKLLFIASLPSKTLNFDGERNKSKDVLDSIVSKNIYDIKIIDYTKNKYLQTIKLIILLLFNYYDRIFISKCLAGGSFALHLVNIFSRKKTKKYFYIIGNGYRGLEKKKLYFDDCNKCELVVVESPDVVAQMIEKGVKKELLQIFPSVKPNYNIEFKPKEYKENQSIKCIFFSRITPAKGLYDAVNSIIEVNEKLGSARFSLDIAGGSTRTPEEVELENFVLKCEEKYDFIKYYGKDFMIEGIDSYYRLQQYDLHIFPSRFVFECAPGSILDMFIAGVPTVSSTFKSADALLSNKNSYFFEQGNYDELVNTLLYISANLDELSLKRKNTFKEQFRYNRDAFLEFLEKFSFF
jgi:glycosyltransferase involved in cell wall biosynthesis